MADSPNTRRAGRFLSWAQLADPSSEQCQRFLAEALAQSLSDLLRSILTNASPAIGANESMIARYRELAAACGASEVSNNASLSISRGSLAKRCVAWLKLLLTSPADKTPAPAMREFVDALGLFPSLFDLDPTRALATRSPHLVAHTRSTAGCEHARSRHGTHRSLRALGPAALAGRRDRLSVATACGRPAGAHTGYPLSTYRPGPEICDRQPILRLLLCIIRG